MADAPFASSLMPPTVIPSLQSVAGGLQVSPKPTVASTETMTQYFQAAVLAPSKAVFPSVATVFVSVRPSSSSCLAEPLRQTSEGFAKASALHTDNDGPPNNDFNIGLLTPIFTGPCTSLLGRGLINRPSTSRACSLTSTRWATGFRNHKLNSPAPVKLCTPRITARIKNGTTITGSGPCSRSHRLKSK